MNLEQAAIDAMLRNDFGSFLHRSVLALNPGAKFWPNWHIGAIAYQLHRIRTGEITRLIINLPPRYLQSLTVSVAFPAFLLGHDPRRKIFGISYGTDLAAKHASDFRAVMESSWYRRAFSNTQIARAVDSDLYTTKRGFRRTTSVSAALTGLGGDCIIIDDPQKPADAQSEPQRNQLNQWFSNMLLSRLDNKQNGIIIITMQRVHLNDLTGYLTENLHGWTVLSLSAIAEVDESIAIGVGKFYQRKAGEALHPRYETPATLERMRLEMGSDIFSAQYQQAPVPQGGAMIRREWFRYYDALPEQSYRTKIIQSWDTAAKDGAQNDWSVCTTWLIQDKQFYLLDVTRGRYEYPRLKETAIRLAERFKPRVILIEDASTGIALAQELKQAGTFAVRAIPVERDKKGRVYVQEEKFEAGRVIFSKARVLAARTRSRVVDGPSKQE